MKKPSSQKPKTRKTTSRKKVRLAIVGTGNMATAHIWQFTQIPGVEIAAVCDVNEDAARNFVKKWESKAGVFFDVGDMLKKADVDAVTVVTPDPFHAPVTLKALAAGKHVLCEKPLATNYADAQKMVRAAAKAGVINMVNFSYRNSPAIQKAAALVQTGKLGEVTHVEAAYFQGWLSGTTWGDWRKEEKWLWRLSSRHGSHGVLGDLGVHILDFASYPVGPIKSIQARLKTFPNLKGKGIGEYRFDANDSAVMSVEFANGALGTVHTTRWATGHRNTLHLRIFGTKGSLRVNLNRNEGTLEGCLGRDPFQENWKPIACPPTPSNYQHFIKGIRTGVQPQPDFVCGARIQKALDACFTSEKQQGKRISL